MFSDATTREVADVEVDSVDAALLPMDSCDGANEAARADTSEGGGVDEHWSFSRLPCGL